MRPNALVVGGSGGIGSAICRRLAHDGLNVTVGYRSDRAAAEDLVSSLDGHGHSTLAIDVADPHSLGEARDRRAARIDRLDVLVNGAGVTQPVLMRTSRASTT